MPKYVILISDTVRGSRDMFDVEAVDQVTAALSVQRSLSEMNDAAGHERYVTAGELVEDTGTTL